MRYYTPDLQIVRWEHRLDGPVYASLVLDTRRKAVLAATTNGTLTCFSLDGAVVWRTTVPGPIYATPAVADELDTLGVATFGSRGLGVDLASGQLLYDFQLPRPWHAAVGGLAAQRDPYASPAITLEGAMVFGCAEHAVCLAPDGTERWHFDAGAAVRASPVVIESTGEVAVCTVSGACHFLSAATGVRVASLSLGGKITASPAVSDSRLVIGIDDGRVFGIDVSTHKTAWTRPEGTPRDHSSFTVLPTGDFIATTSRGNIQGFRRDDGQFLWETSQLLGLGNHRREMDITPIASADGSMYGASYTGELYYFRFRNDAGESY
ncbi:outer membrane protein assembly factor BamB family protein [Nocardia amamiensis]|uniref:outer membrane protein assembly factor BamB family protein n=1 Tax=Nocardia amamiensis TaxID=404578 RepID=UPI002B4AC0AB|nr:PQQ-binding-like beta-propeller repeat protein [Nocardia amamiensis]